jgi:hypothetical protein
MFFKPKKKYLTELKIDLGYYQKVIIIHLIADSQNALFERIENSAGVAEKTIVVIRYRAKNYRWVRPGMEAIIGEGNIDLAISLARDELRIDLNIAPEI